MTLLSCRHCCILSPFAFVHYICPQFLHHLLHTFPVSIPCRIEQACPSFPIHLFQSNSHPNQLLHTLIMSLFSHYHHNIPSQFVLVYHIRPQFLHHLLHTFHVSI